MSLFSLIALALIACGDNSDAQVRSDVRAKPAPQPIASRMAPAAPVRDPIPREEIQQAPTPKVGETPDEEGFAASPPENIEEEEAILEIEVRPGESLVLIADWSGLTVEQIAEANGFHPAATLYPGQLLDLDVDIETFAEMQDARERSEDARLDRFLSRRGSLVGVTSHTVGTGETAWQIAREHGTLPLWVLASFNRGVNLDRLKIGQDLNLPMLGDSVVSHDEVLEDIEGVVEAPEASGSGSEVARDSKISTNP